MAVPEPLDKTDRMVPRIDRIGVMRAQTSLSLRMSGGVRRSVLALLLLILAIALLLWSRGANESPSAPLVSDPQPEAPAVALPSGPGDPVRTAPSAAVGTVQILDALTREPLDLFVRLEGSGGEIPALRPGVAVPILPLEGDDRLSYTLPDGIECSIPATPSALTFADGCGPP